MAQYVLRRVMIAVPMLLGAMSIVFFAMRILPGDPCVAMMGDQATTSALADCTRNLGLNRPLAVQYADFIWRSVQFDFGTSLRQGYPVSQCIARMFPHTFILVMASAVVAALVGIPIGIVFQRYAMHAMEEAARILIPDRMIDVYSVWIVVPLLLAGAVIAGVGAFLPSRAAARLTIAAALHTE